MLDLIGSLNAHHLERHGDDGELAARIQSYELAYRMQSAAPEAVDLADESGRNADALRARRPPHGRVRDALPAGPAARRARRPVRPALLGRRRRLGRARRRRGQPRRDVRPHRSAGRRASDRPEATRPARQHPRHLGRRVRADADVRERQGTRPQPARLHLLACRRRASRAAPSTARPTRWDCERRSTASTSTTCTPRSST